MGGWLVLNAARIQEGILLRQAERRAKARPPEQQARLVELWKAARQRGAAARELRYARQAVAALTLYREAVAILVTARLVERGEHDSDGVLSAASAWTELQRLHDDSADAPPEIDLDALRDWLGRTDTLGPDRLAGSDLAAARAAADALYSWLAGQIEPRSVRRIRAERGMRLGALAVGLALLLGAGVATAMAPTNVALGQPVEVSSQRPGTPDPAGAVDGQVQPGFGFHTGRDQPAWVTIDLGTPHVLSKVVVHNRGDGHFKDSLPLELWLATSDGDWRQVARRTQRFTAARPWRIDLDAQTARFVRLSVPRPTFLALSEVKVYGEKL